MTFSRLGLVIVLAAAPASVATGQSTRGDPRIHQMREYLRAEAALGQLHGSVLVAEGGKVLVDTAYGFADMELGVRNTPNTRFRVASVTKQFTAMAVMMLAESGRLRLTDSISKYLDSLPPEWAGITIHHLLRHTSGISDYEGWFDGYTTQAYSDYMAQAGAAQRIARDARKRPLDFPPGSKFHYSNSAYIMLGFIIERAAGVPYEDFVRTRILEPLGMSRSGMDHSELILPDRAHGYRLKSDAYPQAWFNGMTPGDYQNAVYQLMAPPQGDAGLVTTARDLYKWDQALYTEKLVKRATLDSIFTPGLEGYGYGWFIRKGPNGVINEHSGGLPGFGCQIIRIPEHHRTVILLGNQENLDATAFILAAILRGKPVAIPRARHIVAPDSTRNAGQVGIYRTATGDSVEVLMDGANLVARWKGRFPLAFYPESTTRDFFVPDLSATARFRERDGHIELVVTDLLGKVVVQGIRNQVSP